MLVKQQALNLKVVGSNPTIPTEHQQEESVENVASYGDKIIVEPIDRSDEQYPEVITTSGRVGRVVWSSNINCPKSAVVIYENCLNRIHDTKTNKVREAVSADDVHFVFQKPARF